jgi:hypothetical protein
MHPTAAYVLGAHMDVLFQGTEISLPPAIILDYVYGVAAYKCWRSSQANDEVHNIMKSYHKEHNGNDPFIKKTHSSTD